MAGSVRGGRGGIVGLLDVLDRHGEAIEHDLVCAGWTLDDVPGRLNWRALNRFVRQSAKQPGSAFARELAGDDAGWGMTEMLLASILDGVAAGNWQRGGGKGPRPKPVPRPGVGPKTVRLGGGMTLVDAERLFAARNPAAHVSRLEGDIPDEDHPRSSPEFPPPRPHTP